jgi:uncharacterized membrane protein (UPF0127 family)
MLFPIDVVFVDGEGRVLKIVRDLVPWRIAAAVGARAVVEMAGGSLQGSEMRVGDILRLDELEAAALPRQLGWLSSNAVAGAPDLAAH